MEVLEVDIFMTLDHLALAVKDDQDIVAQFTTANYHLTTAYKKWRTHTSF